MRRATAGFSLVELALVLVILSILLALFGVSYMRSVRKAELRDAATGVVADLREARSRAQRVSSAQVVSWAPGTPVTVYSAGSQARTLPGGITLSCLSGCDASAAGNRVTYLPPYGELSVSGATPAAKILRVSSPVTGVAPFEIRTVGVTGKVLLVQGGS